MVADLLVLIKETNFRDQTHRSRVLNNINKSSATAQKIILLLIDRPSEVADVIYEFTVRYTRGIHKFSDTKPTNEQILSNKLKS